MQKDDMVRFGVSIPPSLLEAFDTYLKRRQYTTRSEGIRDLIRDALVEEEWTANAPIVGTLTIVYDHHTRELADRLTELQHRHYAAVLSTLHVHLDHDNCLEVLVLRGHAKSVQAFADQVLSIRGVKHGKFVATTTGAHLA